MIGLVQGHINFLLVVLSLFLILFLLKKLRIFVQKYTIRLKVFHKEERDKPYLNKMLEMDKLLRGKWLWEFFVGNEDVKDYEEVCKGILNSCRLHDRDQTREFMEMSNPLRTFEATRSTGLLTDMESIEDIGATRGEWIARPATYYPPANSIIQFRGQPVSFESEYQVRFDQGYQYVNTPANRIVPQSTPNRRNGANSYYNMLEAEALQRARTEQRFRENMARGYQENSPELQRILERAHNSVSKIINTREGELIDKNPYFVCILPKIFIYKKFKRNKKIPLGYNYPKSQCVVKNS